MAKIVLTKAANNLCLAEETSALELLESVPIGGVIHADFKKMRNAMFHRKFFAMLKVGYDSFEPELEETKWGMPQKNMDLFREHVLCLAGFGYMTVDLDGGYRMRARSISFGSMGEEEFAQVYSKVADVILQKVLTSYTRDDLENVVNMMLEFVR